MATVLVLVLGWCMLSLPIGILVGRALARPQASRHYANHAHVPLVTPRPTTV